MEHAEEHIIYCRECHEVMNKYIKKHFGDTHHECPECNIWLCRKCWIGTLDCDGKNHDLCYKCSPSIVVDFFCNSCRKNMKYCEECSKNKIKICPSCQSCKCDKCWNNEFDCVNSHQTICNSCMNGDNKSSYLYCNECNGHYDDDLEKYCYSCQYDSDDYTCYHCYWKYK